MTAARLFTLTKTWGNPKSEMVLVAASYKNVYIFWNFSLTCEDEVSEEGFHRICGEVVLLSQKRTTGITFLLGYCGIHSGIGTLERMML